jgi:hypothetical protein
MWLLVLLFVSATTAVTLDARGGIGRMIDSAPQPKGTPPDIDKYGTAEYDAQELTDPTEREKRRKKNQRYDKEGWVEKSPHPDTGMVGRHTEVEPPAALPTAESDLIVTGRVVGLQTHLSNDKTGVYTEYKIKVDQVLKNALSLDLSKGSSIDIDRAGGVVRYPHGQSVIYRDSDKGLPENGREYILFLKSAPNSENYEVITLYELRDADTVPLDSGRKLDDIKRMGKSDFLNSLREKVSRLEDKGRKP